MGNRDIWDCIWNTFKNLYKNLFPESKSFSDVELLSGSTLSLSLRISSAKMFFVLLKYYYYYYCYIILLCTIEILFTNVSFNICSLKCLFGTLKWFLFCINTKPHLCFNAWTKLFCLLYWIIVKIMFEVWLFCVFQVIEVKFDKFDLESDTYCRFDYVAFFNGGEKDDSRRIGKYCGYTAPQSVFIFCSLAVI